MTLPWDDAEAAHGVTIVLVRHGRTAWNAERRFLGSTDVPLDDVGRQEAEALGRVPWSFQAVYASPLSRARETALRLHREPFVVDDLAELRQGHLEGLPGPVAIERFPEFFSAFAADPTDAAAPGGEALGTCRDRALSALDAIAIRHAAGQVVAVVTHQMVIASVATAIAGESLVTWRRHGVRNGAATALRRLPSGWRVLVEDWRFEDPPRPGGRAV